ncbi:MAG: hypothetical protein KI790_19365, partial [Cyclobacteriaceae bacterium]|nr:hypothetical protein [Cyclobacteriaceae bacterium HetDA_MAG_MS6]
EVGKSLDKSKHQYQSAMNKLVVGKDNLIRKTERLKELGAKTTKVMDQKLIDRAEVPKTDRSDTLPEEQSNLFGG